jgi:hypothetical protein
MWSEGDKLWINRKNVSGGGGTAPFFDDLNGSLNFNPGQGYLVAYVDPNSNAKSFTGILNNGDIPFTLKYSGTGNYKGSNLVGNPYPSAIDWNLADRSQFHDEFAYVYDGNDYTPVDGSEEDALIAANQGFIVLSDVSDVNFIFTDAIRVHGGSFLKTTTVDDRFVIRLANDNYAGSTKIRFRTQSTPERDRLDALKLFSYSPEVPQVFTRTTDGINVAVNSIPGNGEVLSIPLSIKVPANGNMTISLQDVEGAFTGQTIFLRDQLTGILHNLSTNPIYSFSATQGDDETRFTLHFSTVGIDNPATASSISVYTHGETLYIGGLEAKADISVANIAGQVLMRTKATTSGLTTLNVEKLPKGVYVVSVLSGGKLISRKVVL